VWALVLIWGANFSVAKAALADFQPLAFNALRFLLASLTTWGFVKVGSGALRIERRDWPALIGLGILGNTGYQILFIFGLSATRAGNAALLLATVPAWVALLSVIFGHESLSRSAWFGIALSFGGIALIVWGGATSARFGWDTLWGDILTLAAALAWSCYTVGAAPYVRRYGPLAVTAVTMWLGGLGLLLVALPSLIAQPWAAVRPAAWGGLVFSGVLAIAVAYSLWYYAVGKLGNNRTAVYSNTIPIVALLIAWGWLGEVPTALQMTGAAAILGGVLLARLSGAPGRERKTFAPE